jgi:basic membrane protein A
VGNELEDYIVQTATENTDVHFCVAKGKQATTTELDNMHSYSVAESESRYVSGVVAGMKLNDMITNGEISSSNIKIGYVGTTRNAENTSSYTAFYLGVKSVCPGVNLEVQYSGLEHSENLERIAANALIANGCILIAQHSYTNGAAETCEKNNVYFVGNITAEKEKAPNFSLVSSSANWADCYTYAANCIINGKTLPIEWSNSYDVGECRITEINEDAFTSKDIFSECKSKVLETENALKEKKLNIFNTATWTVDGKIVETTASDDLLEYYNGVEYIIDGNFKEYESSSLPKFMFRIDGIEELN